MFKLIQFVMSDSRLLTVVGLPGIGKTALLKNSMHYINERRMLKGGCTLFINA